MIFSHEMELQANYYGTYARRKILYGVQCVHVYYGIGSIIWEAVPRQTT